MVGRPSRAFSLPNATYLIHLWGEKNTPLGVITLGLRQAHLMRRWLTLATRLRPSALPSYRRIRDCYQGLQCLIIQCIMATYGKTDPYLPGQSQESKSVGSPCPSLGSRPQLPAQRSCGPVSVCT